MKEARLLGGKNSHSLQNVIFLGEISKSGFIKKITKSNKKIAKSHKKKRINY